MKASSGKIENVNTATEKKERKEIIKVGRTTKLHHHNNNNNNKIIYKTSILLNHNATLSLSAKKKVKIKLHHFESHEIKNNGKKT